MLGRAASRPPAHPDHRRQLRPRPGHGPPVRRHGPRPGALRPPARPARGAARGTARGAPGHPGRVIAALDVDDPEAVARVLPELADRLGGVDRVIVNAGIGKGASIGTGKAWANRAVLVTNVLGTHAQCEAAMEMFRAQGAGHLVLISSVASHPRHARHPDGVRREQGRAQRAGRGHPLRRPRLADRRHDHPARLHRHRHQRRPPGAVHRRPGHGRRRADRRHRARAGARPTCPSGRGGRSPRCSASCRCAPSAASPDGLRTKSPRSQAQGGLSVQRSVRRGGRRRCASWPRRTGRPAGGRPAGR